MIPFLRWMLGFGSMSPEEQAVIVDRLQAANLVLRKAINFTGIYDMFYRRKAKLMMWVPNRINGKKVVKTKSWLTIKRRFGPEHVKARVYRACFSGICGALTWHDINHERNGTRGPGQPPLGHPQPNTPRLNMRNDPIPWIRPRQLRKQLAKARLETRVLSY